MKKMIALMALLITGSTAFGFLGSGQSNSCDRCATEKSCCSTGCDSCR